MPQFKSFSGRDFHVFILSGTIQLRDRKTREHSLFTETGEYIRGEFRISPDEAAYWGEQERKRLRTLQEQAI